MGFGINWTNTVLSMSELPWPCLIRVAGQRGVFRTIMRGTFLACIKLCADRALIGQPLAWAQGPRAPLTLSKTLYFPFSTLTLRPQPTRPTTPSTPPHHPLCALSITTWPSSTATDTPSTFLRAQFSRLKSLLLVLRPRSALRKARLEDKHPK